MSFYAQRVPFSTLRVQMLKERNHFQAAVRRV